MNKKLDIFLRSILENIPGFLDIEYVEYSNQNYCIIKVYANDEKFIEILPDKINDYNIEIESLDLVLV